jgi:serine/threonine-protein kinase
LRVLSRTARFGQFEILSRLGLGGMGEVFRARTSGREIALKLIRPEWSGDSHFHQLFLREGRIGQLLDHPHIVRTLEVGDVDGTLYLASELVEGVSLGELERLPLPLAVFVAMGLLAALDHAHELRDDQGRLLGLVHRDVSPANVLVSTSGDVKLVDFGVAKLPGHSLTQPLEVKGNEAYMAPEQRGGELVDRRADLYAVAVLLHELITGERARIGRPLAVDGALADVIARAMAIDPAERFATARDMQAALAACAAPTPAHREELGMRVAAARPAERPLGLVDQLLMADLAADELVYAPDPTTSRLWLLASDSSTQEITANQRPAVPEPLDAMPTEPRKLSPTEPTELPPTGPLEPPETLPPRASWGRRISLAGWLAALTLALAAAISLVLVALSGPPSVEAIAPPRLAAAPRAPEARPLPTPAPPPAPTFEPVRVARSTPAPPPRPRPDRGVAYLSLDSEPWAVVYLDKRRLGTTPFMHVALPAGHNELSFDLQDSGKRVRRAVDVPRGAHKRMMVVLPSS